MGDRVCAVQSKHNPFAVVTEHGLGALRSDMMINHDHDIDVKGHGLGVASEREVVEP